MMPPNKISAIKKIYILIERRIIRFEIIVASIVTNPVVIISFSFLISSLTSLIDDVIIPL